jgi:plasmid stability protein
MWYHFRWVGSMRDIRIRNVPGRIYKSFLREARRHNHSLEDEVRDAIFEYLMDRHPALRGRLIGRLSRSRRLRINKRKEACTHLVNWGLRLER